MDGGKKILAFVVALGICFVVWIVVFGAINTAFLFHDARPGFLIIVIWLLSMIWATKKFYVFLLKKFGFKVENKSKSESE